tara:strand:- start:189 stop:704 length:516 start_codon:yes stop_codon:yes gene_type:complete
MLMDQRIHEIMQEEIEKLVADMKQRLNKKNSELSRSIKMQDDGDDIKVIMNEYGNFIDKGVTGKGASDFKGKRKTVHKSTANYRFGSGKSKGKGESWKRKIDKWMYKNGIQGRDKKGKFVKRASTNYLIRRSIFQHGIKGTLFASKAFEGFQEELEQRLINIDFNEIINNK